MPTTLIVEDPVHDYDTWRPVFDEHGCTSERVYRATNDPNTICVVMSTPSRDHAHAFIADPSLQHATVRAGVTAAPVVHIAGQRIGKLLTRRAPTDTRITTDSDTEDAAKHPSRSRRTRPPS